MSYDIEELIAKSGVQTMSVNGFLTHSKYNPLDEAQKFAEKNYIPKSTHVIIGYGKGYIIDAFIKKFQYKELLIVVDPLISERLISVKKEHTKHKQIHFLNCDYLSDFFYYLKKMEQRKFQTEYNVVPSINYKNIMPDVVLATAKHVKQTQYRTMADINTVYKNTPYWQENILKNLLNLTKDQSLKVLKNITDKPVVIASGGPSLTKQLPLLKENRNSVILVSAGSTINSLLKEDIYPDYVVSVDGTQLNKQHFEQLQLKETKFVYCFTNQYTTRNSFFDEGYIFLLESEEKLNEILAKELGVKGDYPILKGGATVAHFTLSFARYISSGPIALIGQDLAYTNNVTHAINNKGFRTVDTENLPENFSYIKDYYGNKVLTDSLYLGMKHDFEKLIELLDKPNSIYNCTEGGAQIDGMKQKGFEAYLKQNVKVKNFSFKSDDFCETNISEKKLKLYFEALSYNAEIIKKELIALEHKKGEQQQELIYKVNEKIAIFKKSFPYFIVEEKIAFLEARQQVERSNTIENPFNVEINKERIIIFNDFINIAEDIINELGEKIT